MTAQTVQLHQLEVIGYADVLPAGKGPAVVPPVFHDRNDPTQCFVPPFRIAGNWLVDPQVVSFDEIKELALAERVTLPLGFQHPAQPDWQMWIGVDGAVHYEPAKKAKRNLQNLYREHLATATTALRAGKIDKAEHHARIALAADERALEPDALIAVCHALRGEQKHVAFIRRAAVEAGHSADTFEVLTKTYAEMVPAPACEIRLPAAAEILVPAPNSRLKAALMKFFDGNFVAQVRSSKLCPRRAA
ncbi:MAG: hypothetical protein HY736_26580 [Verrucomicrobia bacterium]|nr:hypothetical protein [Verrucomicrobiota bacterium]